MTAPSLSSQVRISPEILVQPVGDEIVMLDVKQEKYFGLDPVGTRIWELLQESGRLEQVHAAMLEEYEVTSERLEADLLALVEALAEAGILSVDPADPPAQD